MPAAAPLQAVKGKYLFNPDTYLGWRGLDDIQSVTGKWAASAASRCTPPRMLQHTDGLSVGLPVPCAEGSGGSNCLALLPARVHSVHTLVLLLLLRMQLLARRLLLTAATLPPTPHRHPLVGVVQHRPLVSQKGGQPARGGVFPRR